jgi:hypothetical protein
MFNKSTNSLKKYSFIIMILMAFTSCKKDIQLAFDDAKIEKSTNAEIEINETAVQVTSLSSQAVRGVAGAVLLGPAGLLIGALTGKKNSKQYLSKLSLKIEVDDIQNPIHRVIFYDDKKLSLDEVDSKEWAKDAERWVKRISKIIKA